MQRHAFLVRAVNVGSTGRLPMAEWRHLAEQLGATDVSTYINSGNLICSPPSDVAAFERSLERAVEGRYGFFREVTSRSHRDLVEALAANPFGGHEPKQAYVTFLLSPPGAQAIQEAKRIPTGEDVWQLHGRQLYVRYATGAGTADAGMARVGKTLGVPGTARNLLTVRKLVELTSD